ncbi:hypothetical protein [Streptomyces sp. NRRL S-37]|uniref:hypothetical protein n=1 Tax=Streptomyces sp. NRRL S-37 TaxID=1463903 RepID=UPI0004C850A6|nr:hypothetical protein [Streptomyces sp. NRRL S-37]
MYDFGTTTWYLCLETGWYYNGGGDSAISIGYDINRACGGDHWYANNTGSYAQDIGGTWRGGWIPSGNEWIAGSGLAAGKPPAEPKRSATEAIKLGEVRLGSPTGPKLTAAQLQPRPGTESSRRSLVPVPGITVTSPGR